ncbi:hypothetical protein T492DRAFT_583691, partial [Pavlovales sp. CCMP2436]
VRGTLAGSLLERRSLRVAFDASVHGWSASDFHRRCDGLGPAVMIARTAKGALVGEYNPSGWASLGGARPRNDAFLFTYPSGLLPQNTACAVPKSWRRGASRALDDPSAGPCFGPDALVIPLDRLAPRVARSRLGAVYALAPNGGRSIFGGGAARSKAQRG